MEKGYYSIKEFCEYLGVSRITVWRSIKEGKTRTLNYRGRVLIPFDWEVKEKK